MMPSVLNSQLAPLPPLDHGNGATKSWLANPCPAAVCVTHLTNQPPVTQGGGHIPYCLEHSSVPKFTEEPPAAQSTTSFSGKGTKWMEAEGLAGVSFRGSHLTRVQGHRYWDILQLLDLMKTQRKEDGYTKTGDGNMEGKTKGSSSKTFFAFAVHISGLGLFCDFCLIISKNVVKVIHLQLLHLLVQFKLKPETLQIPLHNASQCSRLWIKGLHCLGGLFHCLPWLQRNKNLHSLFYWSLLIRLTLFWIPTETKGK